MNPPNPSPNDLEEDEDPSYNKPPRCEKKKSKVEKFHHIVSNSRITSTTFDTNRTNEHQRSVLTKKEKVLLKNKYLDNDSSRLRLGDTPARKNISLSSKVNKVTKTDPSTPGGKVAPKEFQYPGEPKKMLLQDSERHKTLSRIRKFRRKEEQESHSSGMSGDRIHPSNYSMTGIVSH